MREYKLNGKIVGVVEVPTDCMQTYIHHYGFLLYNTKKEFNLTIDLPEGNWQILSLASEMTDEKAKVIAIKKGDGYKNHTEKFGNAFPTAMEWFKSWLKSLGYVVENPYRKPNKNSEKYGRVWNEQCFDKKWYEEDLAKYEEAQKLVQNLLIIVKEK